jgi:hypothetical protein
MTLIFKKLNQKKTLVKLVILGYQSTDGFNKNQCFQPTKVKKVGLAMLVRSGVSRCDHPMDLKNW